MAQAPKIVRYAKPMIFSTIGYRIYADEVRRMHESSARVKIISAPARTSKSYSAAADVAGDGVFPEFAISDDGRAFPIARSEANTTMLNWVVAPDYKLAKEFDYLFTWFVIRQKKHGWAYNVEKAVNSPEQGNMKFQIYWGDDIHGNPVRTVTEAKSENNERSLQAEEVHRVLMSEAADQQERTWAKYLSTRYGRALLPTTPKVAADWIRRMIDQGAEDPRLRIDHFEYDGRCNPTYDWERFWIEHAKAESRQSAPSYTHPQDPSSPPSEANGHNCFVRGGECFASRDPHFAEQFLGRWTYAEHRVLPFRWRSDGIRVAHVIDEVPEWVKSAEQYVSVDYGFTDPAAACFFAVHPDGTFVVFDEIYQQGLTADEFVRAIVDRGRVRGYRIRRYFGDPKKPEVMKHYNRLHLPVQRVDKARQADRQLGFMLIQDLLSDDPRLGRPKMFVWRGCHNFVSEAKLLHRKEGHTGDEWSGAAIVGADHLLDAFRYGVSAFPRGKSDADRHREATEKSIYDMAKENWRRERIITGASYHHAAAGAVPGLYR